jgi:hypothetical protein
MPEPCEPALTAFLPRRSFATADADDVELRAIPRGETEHASRPKARVSDNLREMPSGACVTDHRLQSSFA